MKKISLLLIITILTSLIVFAPVSYAADNSSDDKAYTLLKDMGIASKSDDLTRTLTRGEYASLMSAMLKVTVTSDSIMLPFKDVDKTNADYAGIANAYAWGLISNAEYFNPDRAITLTEAAKMTVVAVGYDFLAQHNGGWPNGYIYAANNKNLLDNVGGSGEFTLSDAYNLIYNALDCKLPNMEFTNGEVNYSIDSGESLLGAVWHMYKYRGKFTGAQYFGGVNGNGAGGEMTEVAGKYLFHSGRFNTDAFYGRDADVYVDDDNIICSVYLYEASSREILTLSSNQNLELSSLTYTYEDDDYETKKVSFASDALLVYNGTVAKYDAEKFCPKHGSVTLIKGDSGKYDTVIVESYDEIVAGTIISADGLIGDIRDNSNTYIYDDTNEATVFYNVDNEEIGFGDIEKYDVVWVRKSSESLGDKIIVCKDSISGEYTGRSTGYVNIDNQEYRLASAAVEEILENEIYSGNVISASLNMDGDVVYIRQVQDTGAYNIGYMVFGAVDGTGLGKFLTSKVLTEDDGLKIYNFAKSFKMNGRVFKGDVDTIWENLPKEEGMEMLLNGIICYKLNADNLITEVNYADDVSGMVTDNPMNVMYRNGYIEGFPDGTEDQYIKYNTMNMNIIGTTSTRVFVKNETVRFYVPTAEDYYNADDTDYQVMSMSTIQSNTALNKQDHMGYTMKKDTFTSDYLVSRVSLSNKTDTMDYTAPLSVVESVSVSTNKDGDAVEKLTLWYATGKLEVYAKDETFFTNLGVKKGDVIKVRYDGKNVVDGLQIMTHAGDKKMDMTTSFSASAYTMDKKDTVANVNTGMGSLSSSIVVYGNVYRTDGSIIHVLPKGVSYDDPNIEKELYHYNLASSAVNFYKYDMKTGKVTSITAPEVKAYMDVGDNCHSVVIENYSGIIQAVYVYE